MDNASYLDMPQTTAGMHPLARQPKGLGAARSSLQTQRLQRQLQSPKKPRAFPERHCRELLFTETESAATTGCYGTGRVKVQMVFTEHHTLHKETGVSTRQGHQQWDTDSTQRAKDTQEGVPEGQGWDLTGGGTVQTVNTQPHVPRVACCKPEENGKCLINKV